MTSYRRLIEVSIPLDAISAQSAREKSIRHGHISTLHIWWARRPLAACRAAVFAALVDALSARASREARAAAAGHAGRAAVPAAGHPYARALGGLAELLQRGH